MPGISFIYDFNLDLISKEAMILRALDSVNFTERYERKILLHEKSYLLGCSKYDEYPLTSFENDNYLIYLEGCIYDKERSILDKELNNIARIIFQQSSIKSAHLSNWILETDGDFVLFFLDKESNEIAIMNDALGHLPLYYYQRDKSLLISRDIGFILYLTNNQGFDKTAIAQYLLFRHTLGKRTLFENIFRFEPSIIVKINPASKQFQISKFHQFNFEEKENSQKTIKENASQLASLFTEACANRAGSDERNINILALSGGLDSRAVAAGLNKNKTPFLGVTRLRHNKIESLEVKIAGQIANVLNIDWKYFHLDPTKGKDLLNLLKIKNGMNYLAMGFNISFLDKIADTYGSRVIYFTGDMGLPIMKNNCPARRLEDLDDLVDYILYKNALFHIDDVANIVKIKKDDIKDMLKEHLKTYPETSIDQKNVHFQIYEKAFNWGFEGMDRNRYYFWLATPLLSTRVFNYSMNCPDWQKSPYKLYKEFLLKLSPEITAVDYADYKLPITSKKLIIKSFLMSLYVNKLPFQVKRLLRKCFFKHGSPYESNSNIMNCFRKQLDDCEHIDNYLSGPKVKDIMATCNKEQINTLFTITSLIEKTICERSTLEEYYEADFF